MKKHESVALERWIVESQEEWTDHKGCKWMREIIRFTPEIMLCHDGKPENKYDLRAALAAYLRRIAQYLDA